MLNPNYRFRNLLAFNGVGFFCIAFVVFLLSTQPFFLNLILKSKDSKVGGLIGTLGMVDELTSIVTSPLVGSLNDKINNYAMTHHTRVISGSRVVPFVGFLLVGLSFVGYGKIAHLVVGVFALRILFAIGVTSCMSMVTVMLNELSNSDFNFSQIFFWRGRGRGGDGSYALVPTDIEDNSDVTGAVPERKNGKFAAMIGTSTGLGAIFAVLVFLPLPVRLNDSNPNLNSRTSLQLAYVIIGVVALVVSLLVTAFLYDIVKQHKALKQPEPEELGDANSVPYWQLIVNGLKISKDDFRLQVAYVGAFVARATTVATSVFIPLLVYDFYYHTGLCGDDDDDGSHPSKDGCYDGYIFLAILTGVAQTVALVCSPFWGFLIDLARFGKHKALLLASLFGVIGTFGLCFWANEAHDPRTAWCFILVSLIGISQVGTIITSMSLVSSLTYELNHDAKKSVIGSILGLYSLSGGVGILILTKIGGAWSDHWIVAPFFLVGLFNVALAVALTVQLWRSDSLHL